MEILVYILLTALMVYYVYGSYQSLKAARNKRLNRKLRTAALLRVISAALVLGSIAAFIIIHISDETVTYSYTDGIINEQSSYGRFDPVFIILFAAAALLLIASIPFDCAVHIKNRGRTRCVTVSLIMTFAVIFIGLFVIVRNYRGQLTEKYDPMFYRCVSPVNGKSIVICERSHGDEGFGDIFQVKDKKAVKIASFSTEDGYRNGGKYKLRWTASQITVTYLSKPGVHQSVTAEFVEL